MSDRQIEAYLLARDAVRRIQRSASLVDALSPPAAGSVDCAQGDRQQRH